MTIVSDPGSTSQAMLDALRQAVAQTLERKQRLRQYVVQWSGQGPVCIGPDAPNERTPGRVSEPTPLRP